MGIAPGPTPVRAGDPQDALYLCHQHGMCGPSPLPLWVREILTKYLASLLEVGKCLLQISGQEVDITALVIEALSSWTIQKGWSHSVDLFKCQWQCITYGPPARKFGYLYLMHLPFIAIGFELLLFFAH